MIIKGGSRASPKQLASSLVKTDPGESFQILELNGSRDSFRDDAEERLFQEFLTWQVISEITKGSKGLYHAHINLAPGRALTREQWERAADVLEEKLGLQGQMRALVLRGGADRERLHIVWARTDLDTYLLRSDSHNYRAHEQASAQLAQEFSHDIVPGKIWRRQKPE